jgi:protein-S-isoprenylcysteine O-methyltransferase Ste14
MLRAYYELVYLIVLVIMFAVRRYYVLISQARGVKEQVYNTRLDRLMTWLTEAGLVAGFIYIFTDWLDFANYPGVTWLGWIGVPIIGFGLWLLWQAYIDLDRSWSPHVEIRKDQKLITDGVYLHIRHPMYAGYLLLGIGQVLCLANWLAGPAFLGLYGLFYLQRVQREEEMMLSKFGEEYHRYMQRTGRLIPRLSRRENHDNRSFLTPSKK